VRKKKHTRSLAGGPKGNEAVACDERVIPVKTQSQRKYGPRLVPTNRPFNLRRTGRLKIILFFNCANEINITLHRLHRGAKIPLERTHSFATCLSH
jgi:hypothetical protein